MNDKSDAARIIRSLWPKTIIFALWPELCIAVYMLLVRYNNRPVFYGGIILTVNIIGSAVIWLLFNYLSKTSADSETLNPVLGNIMLDAMLKTHSPAFICDDAEGRFIWYNRATGALSKNLKPLYGSRFTDIFNIDLERILHQSADEGAVTVRAKNGGQIYSARRHPIRTANKTYSLIMLIDITEEQRLLKRIHDENMIVAYVIIDNLDELLQYEQDRFRSAASEVDVVLRSFADECGGLLKEYERDKYLFFFTAATLAVMIERRFDILDRVKEVRVGEGNLPVTISMGIANIEGTLAEKEKAAHVALDTALQRGGDQVVVKTENDMEHYGGRTKTVQKRTRVRARVLAAEFASLCARAGNVLVMMHKAPDYDSFGAAVGISRFALFCGTPVNIVVSRSEQNLRGCFDILSGSRDYDGMFVDAVAAQDLVRSDTLLVVVDVSNPERFESQQLAELSSRFAVIDHHRKSGEFVHDPVISYIEPSASSASELVAEMLEQSLVAGTLEAPEASLLYAGILLDTKQFTKNTGTRTFSAAFYLRDAGADPSIVQELFRITADDFVRESRFDSAMRIYRKGIVITALQEQGDSYDRIAAAKAADRLLQLEGIEAAFALVRIEDTVYISGRSSGRLNVQLILEPLGGGGRFDAAGAQIKGATIKDADDRLCALIDSYLKQ